MHLQKMVKKEQGVNAFLVTIAVALAFVFTFAVLIVSLSMPVVSGDSPPGQENTLQGNAEDDVVEEWSTDNVTRALEGDNMLQAVGIVGIVCFLAAVPMGMSKAKTRKVEDEIPDVLSEVAANIRSANSVESSFRDVAAVRSDYLGRLLQQTCERRNETSFSQAMEEFAFKTKSLAVQRIVSLINISIESGASIADVLDKISDELASLYALRRDKENKSGTNATVILWGGILFTPGIIGFILGFFNAGAGADLGMAPDIIQYFLLGFAVECAFMHGVAMDNLKLDLVKTPFYMFIAQLLYVLALSGSPAMM